MTGSYIEDSKDSFPNDFYPASLCSLYKKEYEAIVRQYYYTSISHRHWAGRGNLGFNAWGGRRYNNGACSYILEPSTDTGGKHKPYCSYVNKYIIHYRV